MRFASLGSGSRGNGWLIQSGGTTVLLDCGFSLRETLSRLHTLGLDPASLSGIVVSHEHSDHAAGVAKLAARFDLGVWCSAGTAQAAGFSCNTAVQLRQVTCGQPFALGDLQIQPRGVSHDAAEPLHYCFCDGRHRLGILTDVGQVDEAVVAHLQGCHALVLECNHDGAMLAQSAYPAFLKRRVGGGKGHLSNEQAARLLSMLETEQLQHVVAAHLSEANNRPQLARAALAEVLGWDEALIGVADQRLGLYWRELGGEG